MLWITKDIRPLDERNENIITKLLGMTIEEFEEKYKYLRSDDGYYLSFYKERPINLDFLADYRENITNSKNLFFTIDEIVEMYAELVDVMKRLGV